MKSCTPSFVGCRILLLDKTKSNRLHLVKKNSRARYSKRNWVRFGTNQNVLLKLAGRIAPITGANAADAEKQRYSLNVIRPLNLWANSLELQGIAGTYYARLEGENHEVAEVLGEQYLPEVCG